MSYDIDHKLKISARYRLSPSHLATNPTGDDGDTIPLEDMVEGVMEVMAAVVGMAEVEVGEEGMEGVREWPDQTPNPRV